MAIESIIKSLNVAQLDADKIYFLQVSCDHLSSEQFQFVHQKLEAEFEKYNIKNIIVCTPSTLECRFTEVPTNE